MFIRLQTPPPSPIYYSARSILIICTDRAGCEKTKEEKKELKKVEKNDRGEDSIDVIETVYEDTDTCSIITDGMPSNHSFTSV